MQIWIYFQPGVGGDGFASLLERARPVERFDDDKQDWRIHRFVDDLPKFYAPWVDAKGCFRRPLIRFDSKDNCLLESYVNCVLQDRVVICTSHDTGLKFLNTNDCSDILLRNQVKILLKSSNFQLTRYQATLKNLIPAAVDSIVSTPHQYNLNQFDHVLDIDLIQSDWSYVEQFCKSIGLDLAQSEYQAYQEILAGSTRFDRAGTERYQSSVVDGHFQYSKIN
jgi:hypothetical protein